MEAPVTAIRALAALLVLIAVPARAADLPGRVRIATPIAVENPCGDAGVLRAITARFAWAERNTWRRGFVMATVGNARPSGHPFFEPGIIRRDYCMADSVMTNQMAYPVFYAIEYGQGFASLGNYVDFCVLGLDPWYVHDEACRTVR
jgi:hypothetical protein